jgi:sugar lactone lactonase YvrE
MSNYTKSTNFATKDNLSPGNPLKIVKGTEIDTEFNNIQTAVATKTDNASANITGGSITGITDLAVADGGTGASTAAGGLNNLLPTQTGNANKYLQTDGTNATWDAISISTGDITGTLAVANGGTGVTSSTGTGSVVLSNSPTLVTPDLGTPSALVGTNITGTASGLTAGAVTTNANLTGAVTSVGNATSLGSFTSANLLSALTDETGTGSAVFATSPTLVTPALGTPSALVGTNITGTAANFNINGTVGATTANTGAFTTLSASGTTTLSGNQIISVTDNTNAALRITQTGTGNALLVEDSANPDSTPFVIDANGRVVVGNTLPYTFAGTITPFTQLLGTTSNSGLVTGRWAASTGDSSIKLVKSRSTTIGTNGVVSSGDNLGNISFEGDDGTAFIQAATITSSVDGTPGTSDMPGRLVFSTTADGASTPTERMRISSTGQTTISGNSIISVTDNTNAALRITQLGTGNALLVEDSTNPDASPFVIDANGKAVIGNTTAIATTESVTAQLQIHATSDSGAQSINIWGAAVPQLQINRAGSGGIGTYTALNSGNSIGKVTFGAADGTAFVRAAEILAVVDGTTGTNDMPGRLVFSTTADGASSPTERVRITSAGKTGFATSAPAATVHVAGDTILSNVNVLSASYDSVSFSVAGEETGPSDLFFSPDGLKMYIIGSIGDDVNEYNLSTPWVVSSAVYSTVFSVASQETVPTGLFFRADGTKMYIVGQTSDTVFQYTLSTPWSVATASYDSISFSVATQEINPNGLWFKPNGLSMYVVGSTGDLVYQYTLSTAWNVSTATFLQSFSVSGQESIPNAVTFTGDGSRMFVMGQTGDDVNVYNLTTPWDISTSAFVNVFSVSGQDTAPTGIYIKPDGTKMYIMGQTNDTVYQYTVPSIDIQLTGPTSVASLDVQQDLTVYGNTQAYSISARNGVLVTSPAGLGYGTGSGGTVTQATSRTTGVTLSKPSGAITMFSAAGSIVAATFTVTNTLVAATDTIILNQKSGTNLYVLLVTAVAAGSFNVTFYTTGGIATDAPVINFSLIKGVTA